MTTGIIKDKQTYKDALVELEDLILCEPVNGSAERTKIELLTLLIQDYETRSYAIDLPDAVEAIKFRMEQLGLQQRDLIPFIGSRSKVSEVLNRKRPLTIPMIRALHTGLGIPAKVLIQESNPSKIISNEVDWSAFPLKEMRRRGWINVKAREIEDNPEDVMRRFFGILGQRLVSVPLYRHTELIRAARQMDAYALAAWTARVQIRARESGQAQDYNGGVDINFLRQLVRLSISFEGPILAGEMLRSVGVALVIEPHLPGTYLDGAAIMMDEKLPVVGMTLRHDRLDNFWFTLTHELSHIALHFGSDYDSFVDDLDFEDKLDPRELEADQLAGEILIPTKEWKNSPASKLRSEEAAKHLARKLGVHPSIIAGRMRHEWRNFRILGQLVGYGEVRKHFNGISWDVKDAAKN